MSIKKQNKNYKIDDTDFDDDFFEEDGNSKVKIIVASGVLAVLVIILVVVLIFMNKSEADNNADDLQDNILEYAQIQESDEKQPEVTPEIIDRNEEEPSPSPSLEPTPSPTVEPEEEEIVEENNGPIMELDVKNFSKVKYDTKANLKEMEMYMSEGNFEAMDDLAHLDRYLAMSYSYRETQDYAYYGDLNSEGQPNGKGIAVYADNQYYYGDWVNGVREGEGLWAHYHVHLSTNTTDSITFHMYRGKFKNDLPHGEGQDHYEYDKRFLQKDKNYITNYIGSFDQGLINGEFIVVTTDVNDFVIQYEGTANAGSFEYISESRDAKKRGPVLVDIENPDNYYWLSDKENRNIGVKSYISKFK